jgi:hypothetical protein
MFEWINVKILIRGMTVAALGLALLCTAAQGRSPAGRHHDVSSRAVARSSSESLRATADALPDDPFFEDQWGDLNTGQSVPAQDAATEELGGPVVGIAGDDDGAAKAWSVSTGSPSIVIGETDTGVDYEHPDLAANVWTNPGGIGDCPAGTRGYNVWSGNCSPMDDDTLYGGHGTHVAGIMGAVGENGIGVAGLDWHTSILPVKWLNSKASGETGGLIEALQWLVRAKQEGVNIRVVNDSATFVGTSYSQALSDEIDTLGAHGILFVTAAGNSGENDDEEAARRYPCGYDRPTEICVTASDDEDQLPTWANYGPHTVDLAAPGASIYSTLREGRYGYLSGGSMAAPQVAGAAALILSVDPTLTPQELKSRILAGVTPVPALAGRLISGGILNVCKAMPGCEKTVQAPGEPTPSSTGAVQPAPVEAVGSKTAAPIPLPTISAPVISPARFSVLRKRAGAQGGTRAVGGARIEYRDSERARTIFAVLVARPGVIGAGGSCVRAPARALRQARKCVRWIEVGTFAHVDRAGRNRLSFSGRIGGHGLPPGRYRLQATPVLAGKAGQTRSASFTIASARSL